MLNINQTMKILIKPNSVIKLVSILLIFSMAACSSKKEDTDASKEFSEAEKQLKEKIEEIVYDIPPPSEVPWLLESTGAEYNGNLINDEAKASSYMSTTRVAALNLGVYGADIGYLSSYEKSQEALEYLESSRELADHIGVTGAFESTLIQRFENNLDYRDSLAIIIDEAIRKSDKLLRDENRSRVGAWIVAGSFIEGLYLSTAIVSTYDQLPQEQAAIILVPLIRVIIDQGEPLNKVIELLKSVNDNGSEDQLIAELESLKESYDNLDINEAIEEQETSNILNNEHLINITDKIAIIRDRIISS